MDFPLTSFILSVMATSTPLLLAASGELVVEKSGVLNLGLEGMMLVGAVVGFAVTYHSGSAMLGAISGALAGADAGGPCAGAGAGGATVWLAAAGVALT